jgi:hypothetical protein
MKTIDTEHLADIMLDLAQDEALQGVSAEDIANGIISFLDEYDLESFAEPLAYRLEQKGQDKDVLVIRHAVNVTVPEEKVQILLQKFGAENHILVPDSSIVKGCSATYNDRHIDETLEQKTDALRKQLQ